LSAASQENNTGQKGTRAQVSFECSTIHIRYSRILPVGREVSGDYICSKLLAQERIVFLKSGQQLPYPALRLKINLL
jgi:hypothetical protein